MTTSMGPPPPEYHYGERTYTSLQSIISDPAQLLISSSVGRMDRTSISGDLDILSAARYPHALMEPYQGAESASRKRKDDSPDQYYGGIVLSGSANDGNNSSSGETDQVPPSKRKRSGKQLPANDQEDTADSKRQRGRPRLDTQDETAADRRRTQIRLAQRAYRHRKETTISALKNKVSALQDTIDQMNKTFLDLRDNMVDAGILTTHFAIGRQLKSATEAFVSFSKITATESDDEDEKIAKITNGEEEHADAVVKAKRPSTQDANKWGGRDGLKKSSSRTTRKTNVRGTSFDPSTTDIEAGVEEIPLVPTKKTTSTDDDDDNFFAAISQTNFIDTSNLHGLNELMQFNAQIPDHTPSFTYPDLTDTLTIERPIKPSHQPQGSYTYSFQETTFARRLHRMCLERAFRNLTNPKIDPDYIKRAFRFTFCFSNRKRMLQRFQEMLKRRAGESLENWSVPFFRIGGAGTHFPRRDEEGKPVYPPNMVSPAKAFGPQPWIEVETPRLEATTQEMLENIGFGGEWYDSHDVEEYLKTKGIFLDGQSSFIELDPSVLLLIKSSTGNGTSSLSDSSSITRSPHELNIRTPSPMLDSIADPFIARELIDIYANPSSLFPRHTSTSSTTANTPNAVAAGGGEGKNQAAAAVNSIFDAGTSSLTAPWPTNFFTPQLSENYTPDALYQDFLGRTTQGPVTFDVDMFLERMIEHSACLGRAPGFRKSAIDEALRASVQESSF